MTEERLVSLGGSPAPSIDCPRSFSGTFNKGRQWLITVLNGAQELKTLLETEKLNR